MWSIQNICSNQFGLERLLNSGMRTGLGGTVTKKKQPKYQLPASNNSAQPDWQLIHHFELCHTATRVKSNSKHSQKTRVLNWSWQNIANKFTSVIHWIINNTLLIILLITCYILLSYWNIVNFGQLLFVEKARRKAVKWECLNIALKFTTKFSPQMSHISSSTYNVMRKVIVELAIVLICIIKLIFRLK